MEIQVISGPCLQRSKIPTVIGTIRIGELMGCYQIPEWDSKTEDGYQREPAKARIRSLANEIRKGNVDLPTAILVNRRDMEIGHITLRGGLKFLSLSKEHDPGRSFYIVDGQHRVRALKILFSEDSEKWAEYQIPFVCMIGAGEQQELEMFYVVNSDAKSVKTDLSLELLRKQADQDADFAKNIEGTRKGHQVNAQRLVNELLKISPVWKGRIQLPNEPRHSTAIRSGSMALSLLDVLKQMNFGSYPLGQKAKILDAYWQGIRVVYSEAFEGDNFLSYNLQKTIGVGVFHILFPYVLQLVNQQSRTADKHAYADIMRRGLEGLKLSDGRGELAYGLDCWRAGKSGGTANYSNKAGHKFIADKIRKELPVPRIE